MLIATDDPQTTATLDPELLIEEARDRHRRRLRRRATVFVAIAVLVILGFGIDQLVPNGSGVAAKQSASAGVAGDPSPTVTYEKLETLEISPGLTVQRWTSEVWSATNAPWTYRELTKIGAGPTIEIGAGPGRDKTLGAEQIVYLYRPATGSIYRTGAFLVPSQRGRAAASSPSGFFRQLIARSRVHLGGMRMLGRHRVYVVRLDDSNRTTVYIDKHNYTPVLTVFSDGTKRIVQRTLTRTSMPATTANLARTRLAAAHPGAQVLPAPARIRELYARVHRGLLPLPEAGWREFVLSKTDS
jgi:hypothetical protein